MKELIRSIFGILVLPVVALLLSGCEGGGGDPGFDFGSNNVNVVVAVGDSITAGYDTPGTSYPNYVAIKTGKTVVNAGVVGETCIVGASRVGTLLNDVKPGYLLILFGANDVFRESGPEDVVHNLRNMVLAAKNNKTIPIIGTVTPMFYGNSYFAKYIPPLNDQIRQMATQECCAVADLYNAMSGNPGLFLQDGVHPNSSGQQIIADTFAAQILE